MILTHTAPGALVLVFWNLKAAEFVVVLVAPLAPSNTSSRIMPETCIIFMFLLLQESLVLLNWCDAVFSNLVKVV